MLEDRIRNLPHWPDVKQRRNIEIDHFYGLHFRNIDALRSGDPIESNFWTGQIHDLIVHFVKEGMLPRGYRPSAYHVHIEERTKSEDASCRFGSVCEYGANLPHAIVSSFTPELAKAFPQSELLEEILSDIDFLDGASGG